MGIAVTLSAAWMSWGEVQYSDRIHSAQEHTRLERICPNVSSSRSSTTPRSFGLVSCARANTGLQGSACEIKHHAAQLRVGLLRAGANTGFRALCNQPVKRPPTTTGSARPSVSSSRSSTTPRSFGLASCARERAQG